MKKQYRLQYKIIPIIFIAFLFTPLINEQLNVINNDLTKSEKRKLSKKPEFKISHLDPFPAKYESYYNDHFGLRSFFIGINNYTHFKYIKTSTSPKTVVIGNDDWLYYTKNIVQKQKQFSKAEIDTILDEIKYRTKYYESIGAKYYMIIVPMKTTIYPEFLPDYLKSTNKSLKHKTEHLMSFIKSEKISNVLYLKNALLNAKPKKVFHKFDHHWNQQGALVASKEILEFLKSDAFNPELKNHIDNFSSKIVDIKGGNLSTSIGIRNIVTEKAPKITPKISLPKLQNGKKRNYPPPKRFAYKKKYEIVKTTKNDKLLDILIVRDSFTNSLIKFISPNFNNSIYIWDAWQYQINEKIAEKEKPDIVLTIIGENHIDRLIKNYYKKQK